MKNKTDETLLDTSRIKATFDLKKMNRSKNYLMDWLTFINDSSVLYKYVSFNTSYRTVAPQILWVEKGFAKGMFNDKFYRIKKGDFILKPADTRFTIQSISKDWKMRLVEFRMPQAMQKTMVFIHLDIIRLSNRNFFRIKNYFDLIADCMEERKKLVTPIEYLVLSLLNYINIISADTQTAKQQKNRREVLYENFMEELNREDVIFSRDVSYYACKLQISPKYLGNVVKEISGKSVQHWINSRTLHDAQEILKRDTLPIKEVALKLGFKEVSSFSRFFRRHTGMTPRAYREEGTREE